MTGVVVISEHGHEAVANDQAIGASNGVPSLAAMSVVIATL